MSSSSSSSSSTSPSSPWLALHGATLPTNFTDPFTITAPPHTDIWRRDDDDDVFNAPMIVQSLPAREFRMVEGTVFAPWKTQYDQGGLIVAFPNAAASSEEEEGGDQGGGTTAKLPNARVKGIKHIKAGIEFFETSSVLGIVGTDRYSDWSLSPLSPSHHQKAKFRAVRDGTTLWIYAAQSGEEVLKPMREVKWAFMEGREDSEIWVGVYAAKPTAEEGEEAERGIEVTFEGLVVERV